MDIPFPEPRRIKVTTGAHHSGNLQCLAASHPFTQQVDIVFPSSDAVEAALSILQTKYAKARLKLSDVVHEARTFVNTSGFESDLTILSWSADIGEDDVWCIDQHGLLTLSVCKDTYERLGLDGKKLPFKGCAGKYVIRLPLQQYTESATNRVRTNEALKSWDSRREELGLGPWNVLCHSKNTTANFMAAEGRQGEIREVNCQVTKSTDVHIPIPKLVPHPSSATTGKKMSDVDEDEEDWNVNMGALFEWVGMACLGAQRLKANDRVEPYVALYEISNPSHVGNVTHLRWRGFLGPQFVQSLIDACLDVSCKNIHHTSDPTLTPQFISITSHALPTSPVSYISPSTFAPASGKATVGLNGPLKVPRASGEDMWSLILVPESEGDAKSIGWAMAESVGQWDTRWG